MAAVSDYLRSQQVTSLPDLQVTLLLLLLGFTCDSCVSSPKKQQSAYQTCRHSYYCHWGRIVILEFLLLLSLRAKCSFLLELYKSSLCICSTAVSSASSIRCSMLSYPLADSQWAWLCTISILVLFIFVSILVGLFVSVC